MLSCTSPTYIGEEFPVTICLLQQSLEILCFQLVLSSVHNSAAADLEQQLDV